MATVVYVLCVLASTLCAALLLRDYHRRGSPLLLWSGASFIGFALNNALVFADFIVWPLLDLSVFRALTSCLAVGVLLYGLIWDAAS